jgi:hypothetical protein
MNLKLGAVYIKTNVVETKINGGRLTLILSNLDNIDNIIYTGNLIFSVEETNNIMEHKYD